MRANHSPDRAPARRGGRRAALFALALAPLLLVLCVLSVRHGIAGDLSVGELARGLFAAVGWGEPLEKGQVVFELRLWRTLVAAAVGGSLALAGALLQGLFRNGLASPSILGVTAGASLGAYLAILASGGTLPALNLAAGGPLTPALVTFSAFVGALGTGGLVMVLGTRGGRVSVPALLLVGIAVNTCVGGLLAVIQSISLEDFELTRAFLAWGFGTLNDRNGLQAGVALVGLALALGVVPFVARELNLFAGGEEDARSLGVATARVKWLALSGAALASACSVAVAGQIAFVGLIVPHLVRLVVGSAHGLVLPLSALAGAVFLLGADVLQRVVLGSSALEPGVLMSLFGGPFFLFLLLRSRRSVESW